MSTSAWDLAGGLVPEILGSPGGVLEVADSWRQAGGRVGGAAGLVGQATAGTPSWQGESASAFQESTGGLKTDLESLQTTYQGGAGVLDSYASVLRAAQDAAATLRAQASNLLLDALGDPVKALAAMAALTTIAKAAATIQTEVTHAANTAAAALSTSGISSASRSSSSDDTECDEDDHTCARAPLEESDITRIRAQIDGTEPLPGISQGKIADCYLMGTLAAYLWSAKGREALRNNIRWDESKKAFIVTFYKDGEKKEVEVNDYYAEGNERLPSIVSVYERAYGIYVGSDNLPGGFSDDAMKDMSGKEAKNLNTFGGSGFLGWPWWDDDKYTDAQWKQIEQAYADGQPITASSDGDGIITARTDTNRDKTVDDTDAEGNYRIADGHTYAVVAIDSQYVTLLDPRDYNKNSSGKAVPGGLIRITRADYQTYFNETHIGQIP